MPFRSAPGALILAGGLPPMPIQSPCNKICTIDPGCGLCRGCGRTLNEIAQWGTLTDMARARIMAELPERLARSLAAPAGDRR
jgi:predicted Fe-S protein YdhL (DUF1289 family)